MVSVGDTTEVTVVELPHDPVYHTQVAPVPNVPPAKDNVDDNPEHIEDGVDEAEFAGVDSVLSVTVVLTQVVLLQSPSAAT